MERMFEGKTLVMTGAGCGYGMSSAFPLAFAKEGCNLVLNYYDGDSEDIKEYTKKLEGYGVKVVWVKGDISQEEVAKKLIATAIYEFGKIDILVNVAGISNPKLIEDISFEEWHRMLGVSLDSTFLTCKYAVPYMKKQRSGRIINISSQLGQKGSATRTHYTAAKAGIIGFTKSLARELGDYGITANCIAPGPVETQFIGKLDEDWKKKQASELPLKRYGKLDEVIPSALFLASNPGGNLYTGQTLGPNCGDVML